MGPCLRIYCKIRKNISFARTHGFGLIFFFVDLAWNVY
jgi:hypothetical protein